MQGSSQGFWELGQKALSIHRGVPCFLQLLQPGHTAYTEKVKTVLPPLWQLILFNIDSHKNLIISEEQKIKLLGIKLFLSEQE